MSDASNLLTPLTTSAMYIFIPSLPVTHTLGLFAHCPKAARLRHVLMYPIKGGKHHTIFQAISWVIWVASVLIAFPILLESRRAQFPGSHAEILSAAAAVGSVFAELFMIKSLLVFDPKTKFGSTGSQQPASPAYSRSAVPPKSIAAAVVVGMGALWVSLAGALVWATEYLENIATKQVYIYLSGACLLVGILTTHGLGGKLWHAKSLAEGSSDGAWRFFQPFREARSKSASGIKPSEAQQWGGAAFVATQALGWALFSAAVTSLLWLIAQLAAGMAYCMRCWALGTCSAMGAAYLVLGASIWIFQGQEGAKRTLQAAKEVVTELPKDIAPWTTIWLPILAFYTPVHIFAFVMAATFLMLPAAFASAFWAGSLVVYYVISSQGQPQHTGCREWPWIKNWLSCHLSAALRAWFGKVEVIYDGTKPLPLDAKYIFGYAPHGLFPIGAPYLTLLPDFQQLFPGVRPTPLVASVCFYTPVVRDFCSWCGLRQVAKPTFLRALEERRSVMLVPGGQAELVHTWRFFAHKEFVIYTQHKGFIRLAIQQQAALVPVLCLGEVASLRNFFDWPAMQRWTYKNLGFPIPYLVVGRWGLTPFPSRTGLKFIIGEPISPPNQDSWSDQVDEEAVELLHKAYYAAVAAMFERHRQSFPGCEDVVLKMI